MSGTVRDAAREALIHEGAAEAILRLVDRQADTQRDREVALIHLGLAQSKRLAVLAMNTRRPSL